MKKSVDYQENRIELEFRVWTTQADANVWNSEKKHVSDEHNSTQLTGSSLAWETATTDQSTVASVSRYSGIEQELISDSFRQRCSINTLVLQTSCRVAMPKSQQTQLISGIWDTYISFTFVAQEIYDAPTKRF